MKNISLLFLCFLLTLTLHSCFDYEEPITYTSPAFPLKQLQKSALTHTGSSGWFIIAAGSYSSSTITKTTIKLYAAVNGLYTYMDLPIENVQIKIDNSVTTPTVNFTSYNDNWGIYTYWAGLPCILTIPEKYLPTDFTPITL